MRLMCTTRVKKSPAIGPFLPSTRPAPITPAQLTSRLMPPMAARADSIAAFTSVSEVTSHFANPALLPSAAAAAWPGPSCTSNNVTRPPAATMCRATAWPRPEAPPVTTARASAIFMCESLIEFKARTAYRRRAPRALSGRASQATSMAIAVASPPPIHNDAMPRPPPRARSACTSVARMRAPVAPMGWPSAQAPPLTLVRA